MISRNDAAGRLLVALFQGEHGKMVERSGPGGEGWVIDHFSKDALEESDRGQDLYLDAGYEAKDDIVRAKAASAITYLVYNIFRYVQINKFQPQLISSKG